LEASRGVTASGDAIRESSALHDSDAFKYLKSGFPRARELNCRAAKLLKRLKALRPAL
jgi:hypothetical protein